MSEGKIISSRMYDVPFNGGCATGSLVKVVGEQVYEEDGQLYEQYIYDIVGYAPKNGKHFVALKSNIIF